MKIAIITLPLHTNYGGILQAYALQMVLVERLKIAERSDNEYPVHDVRVVKFGHSAAYRFYHPVSVRLKQRGLVPYSHDYPLSAREHATLRLDTDRFIKQNIRQTPPLSAKELARQGFDAFVVGSDQVWRHFDERYFLGFLPKNNTPMPKDGSPPSKNRSCLPTENGALPVDKHYNDPTSPDNHSRIKSPPTEGISHTYSSFTADYLYACSYHARDYPRRISYAASFGIDRWPFDERQTARARELVARFDAVSVREDSALKSCAERLGVAAVLALDPVMLLDKEEYRALAARTLPVEMVEERNSLMCYVLDDDASKHDLVNCVAEKLGLAVNRVAPEARPARGVEISKCTWPPVEEWLAGFASARFVVTDSFHGTVLAILFNKPFIAICNDSRGAARFHSLLRMFSLEERLLQTDMTGKGSGKETSATLASQPSIENLIATEIDFGRVNEILARERQKSLAFLDRNLFN